MKYERLGTFCFVFGILGHSERDCNIVYNNPDKVIDKAYVVWLRAPSKNAAKVNAGAKWLRNMNDANSSWAKVNKQDESSTAMYGGGQEQGRFMDVDGMIREIHGDADSVEVKSRDSSSHEIGEKVMPTNFQKY